MVGQPADTKRPRSREASSSPQAAMCQAVPVAPANSAASITTAPDPAAHNPASEDPQTGPTRFRKDRILLLFYRLKFANDAAQPRLHVLGDRLEIDVDMGRTAHQGRAPGEKADARKRPATLRSPAVDSASKYLTSGRNAADGRWGADEDRILARLRSLRSDLGGWRAWGLRHSARAADIRLPVPLAK
jgi:hypothetical protein